MQNKVLISIFDQSNNLLLTKEVKAGCSEDVCIRNMAKLVRMKLNNYYLLHARRNDENFYRVSGYSLLDGRYRIHLKHLDLGVEAEEIVMLDVEPRFITDEHLDQALKLGAKVVSVATI